MKRLSLFDFALRKKFGLIESHGRFMLKDIALERDVKPFRLNSWLE